MWSPLVSGCSRIGRTLTASVLHSKCIYACANACRQYSTSGGCSIGSNFSAQAYIYPSLLPPRIRPPSRSCPVLRLCASPCDRRLTTYYVAPLPSWTPVQCCPGPSFPPSRAPTGVPRVPTSWAFAVTVTAHRISSSTSHSSSCCPSGAGARPSRFLFLGAGSTDRECHARSPYLSRPPRSTARRRASILFPSVKGNPHTILPGFGSFLNFQPALRPRSFQNKEG